MDDSPEEAGVAAARLSPEIVRAWLWDSHLLTQELIHGLCEDSPEGPRLAIVNPARWEIGHVAWFTERWFLRTGLGEAPREVEVDPLFDSMVLEHGERWDAPLPRIEQACESLCEVHARVLARVEEALQSPRLRELLLLTLFHQDMHNEAFASTRQSHGWGATPRMDTLDAALSAPASEDLVFAGGTVPIGAAEDQGFAFDNERPRHVRHLEPFALSPRVVSVGEFLAFVEDGAYERDDLWEAEGRTFLKSSGASEPLYWRRCSDGSFEHRRFHEWRALEPEQPMIHASWFEAQAYARWAGRRIPSEFEWEHAARESPGDFGRADAWEWMAEPFQPYDGFRPGDYRAYSEPWFGTRRVLRGGSRITPARMRWPSLRNFFEPHRRDIWSGFRTAAPR